MKDIYKQIVNILHPYPNPVIFEIGSHTGTDTIHLCKIKAGVKVHAFEPDPRNSLNNLPENVNINYVAVSNKEGEIEFYQSDRNPKDNTEWTCSSSIRKPKNHLTAYDYVTFKQQPIKVKSIRLDDYCKENKVEKIDFIWMDVQGAEGDVIEGGREILKRTRYLYTEYSDKELYEGELTLQQILSTLPGEWKVLKKYERRNDGDVLLRNLNFQQ